jgi:hypothetical protein
MANSIVKPIGMASKHSFLEATVIRRSTIDLKKESTIPDSRIIELIKHAVLHAPSPFNSQTTRAVVLLHQDHEKLWDIAYEYNSKTSPPEVFNTRLGPNLKAYKASYGTVRRGIRAVCSSPSSANVFDRYSSTKTPKPSTNSPPSSAT